MAASTGFLGLAPHDAALVQALLAPVLTIAALVAGYAAATPPPPPGAPAPRWFAANPAKRWTERFFLYYSAVWVTWFGWVVVSGVWEHFAHVEYLAVCGAMAAPCVLAPLALQPAAEAARPWWSRNWVKANAWIAVISYVGNYFWTHYFFTLLGADYTFPSWRINHVPIAMFLATHAYFCTYHTLTTMALRRWWTSGVYTRGLPAWLRTASTWALVAVLAWFTAFLEAFTIQGFPYYRIRDRQYLYTVGAVVYGLYFVVSFPMYARLDEDAHVPIDDNGSSVDCAGGSGAASSASAVTAGSSSSSSSSSSTASADDVYARGRRARSPSRRRRGGAAASDEASAVLAKPAAKAAAAGAPPAPFVLPAGCWTLSQAVIDSLGGCMAVTILLDLWRLGYGAYSGHTVGSGGGVGLTWMPIVTE
jgi:cycloeucalenol cycloisomerase